MNDTIKMLLSRRSIRRYKAVQIKDEELNAILEAGRFAPSAANQQSALFIVVQDKTIIAKLSKMNAAVMGKDMDPFYGAPTVILVLGEKDKAAPVEDASLAMGNMFNAAFSLGIGSCWIHRVRQMFESDEGKLLLKEWGVISEYIGVGACILGYPDCDQPAAAPRKENIIFIK